jgi:transcriptional regulator with PAS, ATPase and Fis domain
VKKEIFITSLNSTKLKEALMLKGSFQFQNETDFLDVFVFDTLEVLNGIFLNESNVEQQSNIMEKIIKTLEDEFLVVDSDKRKLVRCSQYRKILNPYISAVYQEYYSNSKFEKHCKNQVFQNLQPKLKKLSIVNNKSHLIDLVIPFLLVEIALYLYLFDSKEYKTVYGLEQEMEIIFAIKNQKYSAFTKFLKSEINYIKLTVEANAKTE